MRHESPVNHLTNLLGICRSAIAHMIRIESSEELMAVACNVGEVEVRLQDPIPGLPEDVRNEARRIACDARRTVIDMELRDLNVDNSKVEHQLKRVDRKLGRLLGVLQGDLQGVAA